MGTHRERGVMERQATKRCTKCGEEKSLDDFSLASYVKKDGTRTRHSWCKKCIAASNRERFAEHPEQRWHFRNRKKAREKSRELYHKDPIKNTERCRKWREANRTVHRELVRKWREDNRFLIAIRKSGYDARDRGYAPCTATPEEIEKAFTGFCHYCGAEENGSKLHMDHDHDTGEFRGWLCRKCNTRDVLAKESGAENG